LSSATFSQERVDGYLLRKQHLAPRTQGADIVQIVEDICALHSTVPSSPYLSLWSRVNALDPESLDVELYETRRLVRLLCMRRTLHVVASEQLPIFFQALRTRREGEALRQVRKVLVLAGMCREGEEEAILRDLLDRVMEVLGVRGPSTVAELGRVIPALRATVKYSSNKPYAGEFSLGSRLVPAMCALGLAVRTRPRGTRRSNLHTYAAMAEWLPDVDLESISPEAAQTELLRCYLAAFGPATLDDAEWWTGLSKTEISKARESLAEELETVFIEGLEGEYLMLADDAQRLRGFVPAEGSCVCLLPELDPYIMGYRGRRRLLAPEHSAKVFDRAGNAVRTVWVNGKVVGAWSLRKDGSVACGLFQHAGEEESGLLEREVRRLEGFLRGESLSQRMHTPFTRALLQT